VLAARERAQLAVERRQLTVERIDHPQAERDQLTPSLGKLYGSERLPASLATQPLSGRHALTCSETAARACGGAPGWANDFDAGSDRRANRRGGPRV
jgi:hypothetical protein